MSNNRSEVTAAREFLEQELPRAKAEAELISEALKRFNEENNIIVLPDEAGSTVVAISNLDNEVSKTQVALVAAESSARQLSRQLGMSASEALDLATVSQSPAVQELLAGLAQL